MAWNLMEERQNLANGKYKGYEIAAAKALQPTLPRSYYSAEFEDVLGWIRVWALEAIDRFDDTRGVKFTTYLYKHLKLRSLQEKNWAWLRKIHPQHAWFIHFSTTRDVRLDGFSPEVSDHNILMEMEELRESLSPTAQRVYDLVVENLCTTLYSLFEKKRYAKVAAFIGSDLPSVKEFVAEVQETAYRFV